MSSIMFLTAIDSSLKKEVKKEKPIETKIEIKVPEQQIENLNPSIMSIPKKTKDLKGEKKIDLNKNTNAFPKRKRSVEILKINEENFFKSNTSKFSMENLEIKYNSDIINHKTSIDLNNKEQDVKRNYLNSLNTLIEEVLEI